MKNYFESRYIWMGLALLLIVGGVKFYHYNYIENTRGQARTLKLTGLREFVCQGMSYESGGPDHCGRRSLWRDSDWGVTAYESVFGVDTKEEAQAIADFMVDARKKDGQQHIPMNLEVYVLPRSQANHFRNIKIFDQRFEATQEK